MHHFAPGEEKALIERAATGDTEAFRPLVLAYEGKLLAYLTRMLGDVESARDIAQDTFIAVFHSLPRWQVPIPNSASSHPVPVLAPWLYRIATNHAVSLLRKRQVRQRLHVPMTLFKDGEGEATEPMDSLPASESFEERYIARDLLRQALTHLSEADAACLVLHFVEGERYAEIGLRLGLSNEAVRKRVHRALSVLRKVYATLDSEVSL